MHQTKGLNQSQIKKEMSIKKTFTDDDGKIEVGVFERIPLRLDCLKYRHREHGKQATDDTRDAV